MHQENSEAGFLYVCAIWKFLGDFLILFESILFTYKNSLTFICFPENILVNSCYQNKY